MTTWYVTRETVKAALDSKETARNNARVDRCIEAATNQVTGLLRRLFDPYSATFRFPVPTGETLWFDKRSLVSATSVAVDGTELDDADYLLMPLNDGPPYDGIRVPRTSSATLLGSDDPAIEITGVWGYNLVEVTAGATAEALDATETAVDLTGAASAEVGIGSVIRVDSERMTVTARSLLSTGVTLSADVTANRADTSLSVSSGAGVTVGAEKMTVQDVAGNTVIVTRAVDGSALTVHTASAVLYAPRTVTVLRGALGTTAATHTDASDVHVWQPPALVGELALAYVLTSLGQSQSGYARTAGSGDNEREAAGRGLRQIQADAVREYKRWMSGAV